MGYKEDVEIDIDNLDAELLRQASLYQFWGRREASILYKKDQLEETLSKCKAKVELAIRADPEKFGYTNKLTEGAVCSLLILQPEVEEATETFLKSKYKARILGIAVKSFEHKKKALEKLVDLYINGYWATPKVDPEAQEAFEEQAQRIVNKTMKGDARMIKLAKEKEARRLAKAEAEAKPKIEADLKKEDRLTAEALKKEIGRLEERNKAGDNGAKVNKKRQPTVGKGAETKPKAKPKTKKDTYSGNYDPKTGGRKPKPKPKSEPKPVGRTKEELLKQSRPASSSKSPGRKKK